MSWFERKLITVLSMILGLLCVALLLVLSVRYRAAQSEANQEYIVEVEKAETAQSAFTSISYRCDKIQKSFSLDETGKWYWISDPAFPLNSETISTISTLVENLTPQQTLPPTEDLSGYELDDPAAYLSAVKPDGTEFCITIGKATTDGNSRYALLSDRDDLCVISDTLYNMLKISVYDMYTLPTFPAITEETVQTVILQGQSDPSNPDVIPRSTFLTALHSTSETDSTTFWHFMNRDVTNSPAVQALTEDIMALEVAKCVDYHPSAGALSLCGFDAPFATLTVHYTTSSGADDNYSITFGNREPGGSGRYVQIGTEETIFLMENALLDPMMSIAQNGLS